jgi:hypothetical protein
MRLQDPTPRRMTQGQSLDHLEAASWTGRRGLGFVTQREYDHMHWETRMQWCDIMSVTVLQQIDVLQSMGSKWSLEIPTCF